MDTPAEDNSVRRPIGIFDSGVGGLTVARSIIDQLPHENIIYIGDTAHAPYGDKPQDMVKQYSQNIADSLVEQDCKMIVIACNTATAAFEQEAKKRYGVPIVEVITPAVRRALAVTHNGKIGVIGTQGTVDSGAYEQRFYQLKPGAQDIQVISVACPQFVPFVERGITSGRQLVSLAEHYLEPLKEAGVDTLVLGCTHYPLLTGVLSVVMGDDVTLVSSAEETAKDVYKTLNAHNLLNEPRVDQQFSDEILQQDHTPSGTYVFESTGDLVRFEKLASRFLGPRILSVDELK